MEATRDPIDKILNACGMKGAWEPLLATGLANRIYATKDVVIRVAKEHEEALRDARTESIAAPVAYAAGVLTPRLLVFDDSRELLDVPYSIWERVHGETLGFLSWDPNSMPNTWRKVGYQMALLHVRVQPFDDLKQVLHEPERDLGLESLLEELAAAGHIGKDSLREISLLIDELRPAVLEDAKTCFLHGDVKDMNIIALALMICWR